MVMLVLMICASKEVVLEVLKRALEMDLVTKTIYALQETVSQTLQRLLQLVVTTTMSAVAEIIVMELEPVLTLLTPLAAQVINVTMLVLAIHQLESVPIQRRLMELPALTLMDAQLAIPVLVVFALLEDQRIAVQPLANRCHVLHLLERVTL